ncbi:thioredoxin-domain-containing protein [Ascobolus immersus RN42]|uniref:protein disulfide-isomerase n=1 Tax=Ascobolus immersus RN42 TaxID=1160509 RepID=A0A3N4IQL9_ASCIM|nr:thioredoxin-domain-containing protein [Ascobolus immersus RN42]
MVCLKELALASLLLTGSASALYSSKGPVLQVNEKNFKKEILNSNTAAIVEFFAPWCGHCKNLAPEYQKAAKNLQGIAKVAAVDCDNESNKKFCSQHGVQGFPTLKVFTPSNKPGKPKIEDYNGARTAKAIVDTLVERIPNKVARVSSKNLDDHLSRRNETTKAILFTNKGTTSAMYKGLALTFADAIDFAQIRDTETAAVERFGITKFPTLLVIPGGKTEPIVYDGDIKREKVFEFLKNITPPLEAPAEPKKDKKASSKSSKASKSSSASASSETPETSAAPQTEPEPAKAQENIIWLIPGLMDLPALQQGCFTPHSKTCIIALTPTPDSLNDPTITAFTAIHDKLRAVSPGKTRFYKLNTSGEPAEFLHSKVGLKEGQTVLAVNGHRRWVSFYEGKENDLVEMSAWVDDVRLGTQKKVKLDEALLAEQTDDQVIDESKIKEPVAASEEPAAEETVKILPVDEEVVPEPEAVKILPIEVDGEGVPVAAQEEILEQILEENEKKKAEKAHDEL